uniref:Uncharacterized protein n=1 Tax=Rhizophora mucronata TaxID=61149 RepID=A0A2P2PHH2_RHIMU
MVSARNATKCAEHLLSSVLSFVK